MSGTNGREVISLSNGKPDPKRAEVWRVGLDPTKGSELRKTRPVVVISSNAIGVLPIRLVAPFTAWKESFKGNIWHVKVSPTEQNGLSKTSAVDLLQVRGIDTSRCDSRLGRLPATTMEEIVTALAIVIEYR